VLGLGTVDPIGHADFYPNGGHRQHGSSWNKELESWSIIKLFGLKFILRFSNDLNNSSMQSRRRNEIFIFYLARLFKKI